MYCERVHKRVRCAKCIREQQTCKWPEVGDATGKRKADMTQDVKDAERHLQVEEQMGQFSINVRGETL